MRVEKIALNGFRNYGFETAEFDSGTNVYGEIISEAQLSHEV